METVFENYLIKYYSNVGDIRINIYNRLNGKKYGLTDVDTVEKYKGLGIDINECITQCLTKEKFELHDKNSYITLSFSYLDVIKFQLICKNILCEARETSVLELEMKIKEQDELIEILKSRIRDLEVRTSDLEDRDYAYYSDHYEYNEHKIYIGAEELYFCEFMKDNVNIIYGLKLDAPCFYYGQNTINKSFDITPDGNTYQGFVRSQYVTKQSQNEIYDSKEGRIKRLIFESKVDLSLIPSEIVLSKLGCFNIKLDISDKIEHLKSLECVYLENVTLVCTIDKFEKFLLSLTKLEELSVKNCKFVTDHTIKCINSLPELKKIWCTESGIVAKSSFRKGITLS